MPRESDNDVFATADRACALCRDKKIKCGREKPKCGNCRRQRWKCDYSAPEKRVSHIKLLSENVNSIDVRLGNIENEIFRLSRTRCQSHSGPGSDSASMSNGSPIDVLETEEKAPGQLLSTERQLLQSPEADSYYGPETLYAWTVAFQDFIMARYRSEGVFAAHHESTGPMQSEAKSFAEDLQDFTKAAINQELMLEDRAPDCKIQLPPKQFLPMFHTQMFQNNDWSTDLFVQSRFWENVDRVYSNSSRHDEAWAIVFNTMILLSMSTEKAFEGDESLTRSQFAAPFFSALKIALIKVHLLTTPKLINVQALALLSLAAEIFYPMGVAEAVFNQAASLARCMALDQVNLVHDPVEEEERLKVYRALYLRDKSLAVSRGTTCCLSGSELPILHLSGSPNPQSRYHAARIAISGFQERLLRPHPCAYTDVDSATKAKINFTGAQQALSDLLESDTSCNTSLELWLEFLAARIAVLRQSVLLQHVQTTLQDCRTCCILLVTAFGKCDSPLRRRLERELRNLSQQRARSPVLDFHGRFKQPYAGNPRNLLHMFPVSAVFILVANFIEPTLPESFVEDDLVLLQRVLECFDEAGMTVQAISRASQVGITFAKLLRLTQHFQGLRNEGFSFAKALSNDTAKTSPSCPDMPGIFDAQPMFELSPTSLPTALDLTPTHTFGKDPDITNPFPPLSCNDIDNFIFNDSTVQELGMPFPMDSQMAPFMMQRTTDMYGMDLCYGDDAIEAK